MTETTPVERAIDIINRATDHTVRSIEVPEWNGLKLYFTPLTTADMQVAGSQGKDTEDHHDRNIRLLINKAMDEQGKPLFRQGDAHHLKQANYEVLQRVIGFMYETAFTKVEDAQKAVEGNPSSTSA